MIYSQANVRHDLLVSEILMRNWMFCDRTPMLMDLTLTRQTRDDPVVP